MPQLNIKDDETHRMAGDLARLMRSSSAAAVKTALAEALERRRPDDIEARKAAVYALLRRIDAETPPGPSFEEIEQQIYREWEIDNGLEPLA